jgi:hypothetical protein
MPARTNSEPATSRRPTTSGRRKRAIPSSISWLVASVGCTIAIGASARAVICKTPAAIITAIASSHRGRWASRSNSEACIASLSGERRASRPA